MAGNSAFGTILREAREHKGIGIDEVARRLRVRPDILYAIEACDFRHMPPQGYARNMINSYARYLGLNPTEITTLYLEAARKYQNGTFSLEDYEEGGRTGRSADGGASRNREGGQRRRSSRDRGEDGSRTRQRFTDSPEPRDNRSSRGFGDRRKNRGGAPTRSNRGYDRQADLLNNPRSQSTIFADTLPKKIMRKLPTILIAVAAIALLVFIATSAMSCANAGKSQEVTNVPITGISDTTKSGNTNANGNSGNGGDANNNTPANKSVATETAPTYATLQYTVEDGKCAYIEIYEDDQTTPVSADVVYGPETDTKQVSSTLKIVTTAPEYVKVTVDGNSVELTSDSEGVYSYTVNFADVLKDWTTKHSAAKTNTNTNTGN